MEIKFFSKIYRCEPILDNGRYTADYEEVLFDSRVFSLSDNRCSLEDVHQYVCGLLREFSVSYPCGRYRVSTVQCRVKRFRSSYIIIS